MNSIHYLIIGGGIAGTSAAATIRKYDKEGRVVIVSDEPYRFYSRIMLSKPNFFLGKIPFEKIWLKDEQWYTDNNIELEKGKTAVTLNIEKKIVTLNDGTELKYKKLLIAVGGHARKLPIPGTEKKGVFYLRNLDDAKGLIFAIKRAKQAVVIGGGFVGFEAAEIMRQAAIHTTFIYLEKHFQDYSFGEKGSKIIETAMEQAGVTLKRDMSVAQILGDKKVSAVKLRDGTNIACDLVVIGIGIVCTSEWLQKAGIAAEEGILANEYMETNKADIWVAGDCAEFNHPVIGGRLKLGNWANAQFQGIAAGRSMTGARTEYSRVTSLTSHGFGLTIGSAGDIEIKEDRDSEERLNLKSKEFIKFVIEGERLVGAITINSLKEMGTLVQLIKKQTPLSQARYNLKNPEFDLKQLL